MNYSPHCDHRIAPARWPMERMADLIRRHRHRTGWWPSSNAGDIVGLKAIIGIRGSWGAFNKMLAVHHEINLRRFVAEQCPESVDERGPGPGPSNFRVEAILSAMSKHHELTGRWPSVKSGYNSALRCPWVSVDSGLRLRGSSIAKLRAERFPESSGTTRQVTEN